MSNSLWPKGQQHTRPPCPSPSLSLPKFKFIASVMLSSHLILWRPLLLLPSIFPSIWDFSNESSIHIRWPKYWSFSFSISPCMNIQGWSPLRLTARFELLAVLAFRSPLQHHSSKASIFWHSAFFMAQLSQSYVMSDEQEYWSGLPFPSQGAIFTQNF